MNVTSNKRLMHEQGLDDDRRVCKVRTQDPENLDEEVKSLVSAWRFSVSSLSSLSVYNSFF